MPYQPKRPCTWPGCSVLTTGGRCDKHKKQEQREYNRKRGGSTQQGYDSKWQRARAAYLRKHPLCTRCHADGMVVAATVVDHIKPHKGDMKLFWDEANWQSLCKMHHDSKTAREDGRWG